MRAVKIAGTGSYLPDRIVSNEDIAGRMDSTPDWIVSHTGIEKRHVAAPDESASSMGVKAATAAMEKAGVKPEEIGLVVLATTTPDYCNYPSTACVVQAKLGCTDAAAFDLAAACSGFVYGLEMAKCYLLCHPERKALVIGAEVLTRQVDYTSRSNAMLFGDASGAVVLEAVEVPDGMKIHSETILGADGNGERTIYREGGSRCPPSADHIHDDPAEQRIFPTMQMDGHTVFSFAVRKLDEVVRSLCTRAGFGPEQLDWVFAHQANFRILESVARRMKMPLEKFYMNLKNIGNTSSASIPLCLDEAVRAGKLKEGQLLAACGFGAGLTWAGALMTWPYL